MRKPRELSIKELLDAFEYHDNLADIRDELIERRKEAGFEWLGDYLAVRKFNAEGELL